jgi:phenylacetate-CoA ligase
VTDCDIRLEEVKTHMRTLTGDERYLDRYWVNATSGSSGHPGLFLFNRTEWITVLASFARAREWASVKFNLTSRVHQL